MEPCASAASLLASVREQERQFEMLSRALEEERRSCAGTLPRPLHNMQNGRIPCDADLERLTLHEGYINGTHKFRMEPGQPLEETFTVEEPQVLPPVISVETSDDGTTKRTETTVKKVLKTTTTRTVIPSVSDTMSVDGGGSVVGRITQPYRQVPGIAVPMEYPINTVHRNYQYGPVGDYHDYCDGPPSEMYPSLNRGVRMDDRYRPAYSDGYRTLDPNYRAPSRNQLDLYAAQPQVGRMGSALELSSIPRFIPDPYGLEDDQRSIGYDEPDYGMGPPVHYSTVPRNRAFPQGPPPRRTGSYEGALDGDLSGDLYYYAGGAPLAQGERGSVASLDTLRKEPASGKWRHPELSEVIAMLSFRHDPVKSNAAAYLQHLTYKNEDVKCQFRRLKGIPPLVALLDSPNREVHFAACGALKNISYGQDQENKTAINNCNGLSALVRLLNRTPDKDRELKELITGIFWNLSSHESLRMAIANQALNSLSTMVIIKHSGWEPDRGGPEPGKESSKPRHLEWETALTNAAGCLRNVSSERKDVRRMLRECTGLVDSIMHIVYSKIDLTDLNNKLTENCVCILRNLSYHLDSEIPEPKRGNNQQPIQRVGRFSSLKVKAKKRDDQGAEIIELPLRTSTPKDYELLFQPEVVGMYKSLLKASSNNTVLEASAGALQNLTAKEWIYGKKIRSLMQSQEVLPIMITKLQHQDDRVVRAMSGALRNAALDPHNKELLSKHAIPTLVANLPSGSQSQPVRAVSEETVLSVLNTLNELLKSNVEGAKILSNSQGIERLLFIVKERNRSDSEAEKASHVLQTVWEMKALRRTLKKDGWKPSDFKGVQQNRPKPNGRSDDNTLSVGGGRKEPRQPEMIPINETGPDAYSTMDQRGRNNTQKTLDTADQGYEQGGRNWEKQDVTPLLDSYDG